ncbi:hypothetical protein [Streptomyces sp. NPDC050848]|uniref:hypothetical protein n=1 Tax=Streptomyces sp. NPDC050848 TaxID=3155791 RepID=UPI0033E9594C
MLEQQTVVAQIKSFPASADVVEDLASVHRLESSISGLLRAAGKTPADIGTTTEAVDWADNTMRAM